MPKKEILDERPWVKYTRTQEREGIGGEIVNMRRDREKKLRVKGI